MTLCLVFSGKSTFGERLGEVDELIPLYQLLGRLLKQSCIGWQASVFTGNKDLGRQTGLRSWRHIGFIMVRLNASYSVTVSMKKTLRLI